MATPDRVLSSLPQAVTDLQKRVSYIDQRSAPARLDIEELSAFASGGGLTTSPAVKTSVTFTTPDGYTSAMIIATASAQVKNTRGVSDNLRVKPNIAGADGFFPLRLIQAGTVDSVAETMHHVVTGLSDGDAIVVQCLSWADGATWTSDAGNSFAIRAACWFVR